MPDKISIAIADDHAILRDGLTIILNQSQDFLVNIAAANGRELVDKIREAPNKPDICILDINMPVMDGYETLAVIKKNWPSIKIVILTISYTEYTIIRTLREGASCCLPKEIDSLELLKVLQHVYSHGIYYTEHDMQFIIHSLHDQKRSLKISDNEVKYLRHACSDQTHKEIAIKMGVSNRTVDSYRDALCNKLGLKNRIELVIFAIETGLRPSVSSKPESIF